jgi:hypothetical protein
MLGLATIRHIKGTIETRSYPDMHRNDPWNHRHGGHSTNIFYFQTIGYYYENARLSGYPVLFIDYACFSLPVIHGGP